MMEKMKIAALVPMRHHSQRVPGKNYRDLAGKPLYTYIIDTLLKCPEISELIVDTDSPVIRDGLTKDYPSVIIIDRPDYLKADDVPMNEILLYDTSFSRADLFVQTHSTNPLLSSATISQAIARLIHSYPSYDSLFGVTRLQTRLWDALARPVNHNPAILLQTQDLPPIYEENSCIYIFNRDNLLVHRNRLGARPMMFEIDRAEAWDIDEMLDFDMVDLMMRDKLRRA